MMKSVSALGQVGQNTDPHDITEILLGPTWWSYGSWIYNYLCHQCLSPLKLWVRIPHVCSFITLCDKVCQWIATRVWFSSDTPVSSTNKTDRHNVNKILLKVSLNIKTPILLELNRFQHVYSNTTISCTTYYFWLTYSSW